MNETTTPTTDILESMRAVAVAATERHAALLGEVKALEAAFPNLRQVSTEAHSKRGTYRRTEAERQAQGERMRQRWAAFKAANGNSSGPAVQ